MKLTMARRLSICWEVLTTGSGHPRIADEKQLPIFQRGYHAGMKDANLENEEEIKEVRERCARTAEEVVLFLSHNEVVKHIRRAVLNA